jgi:hypothetical protein
MSVLRRVLGVLIMISGILGLLLSLAGLVSVWVCYHQSKCHRDHRAGTGSHNR